MLRHERTLALAVELASRDGSILERCRGEELVGEAVLLD